MLCILLELFVWYLDYLKVGNIMFFFFFLNIEYLFYLLVYKIKTRNYNDFMEYCTLKKCINIIILRKKKKHLI